MRESWEELSLGVQAIIVSFVLLIIATALYLGYYKTFAPQFADAERTTYEHTRSYVEGSIRDLENLCTERASPNSQPAQPAAPPVVQPTMVVVVPQGQPVLPAQPTAVPTAIPVVTPFPQEFYQAPTPVLAAGAPAIGAPECNSQSAQFKGEKDVVLDTPPIDGNGIPLGHIAAWSCTSQDNVVVELQQRELEMIEKFKAKNSG